MRFVRVPPRRTARHFSIARTQVGRLMIPQTNVYRSVLGAGRQAPEFTLQCSPHQTVSLSECCGRPAVLAFYPAYFSPVCGDQMPLYNEMLNEFQELEAELV